MTRDFLPQSWAAFAEWLQNFYTELTTLAPKYGLADEAALLEKDNLWTQYWIQAKMTARQQEKQLGDYVEAIVNGDTGDAPPTNPAWALPANPPLIIAPGLKKKIRALVRQIKANPVYTTADGELLGIIGIEEAGLSPETAAPELKLRSLPNYNTEADFRKNGMDALRIESRHKGGQWQLAAILTNSPGTFNVIPQTAGDAEQIEIRAVFLLKNQLFGNYSPTYNVVIEP